MTPLVLSKLENFFGQFNSVHFYKKREIIVRADDDPSGTYYLKNGYVRLYSISEEGRETTFNIFKPATFFSMIWAIGGVSNSYFFEAITPVEVWRAPKNKFLEFIRRDPEILFDLTRRVLIGLDGLITMTGYLLSGDARAKVIATLILLSKRFGERKNNEVIIQLPLTHNLIASLAGLSREVTTLELLKLQKSRDITYGQHICVVKNIKKLSREFVISKKGKLSQTNFA